jgi:hypothetical protein
MTTNERENEQCAADETGRRMCYVRPVLARDVRDEIQRETDDEIRFSDDSILYALHAADGSRIALMSDRAIAFAAAKQHEMVPVSVH